MPLSGSTGNQNQDKIAEPSAEYDTLEERRSLIRALREGQLGFVRARNKMLWQSPAEDNSRYNRRLMALDVDPYFWRAAMHLSSLPWQSPYEWDKTTHPDVIAWADESDGKVNGRGMPLDKFGMDSCLESCAYGMAFILVWPTQDGSVEWIRIDPQNVLDPKRPGAPVRILSANQEQDPERPWEVRSSDEIWAIWQASDISDQENASSIVQVYERSTPFDNSTPFNDTPTEDRTVVLEGVKRMPLVPVPTGYFSIAEDLDPWAMLPPLWDLARQNLVYVNKKSEHDAALHSANIPQITLEGIDNPLELAQKTVNQQAPGKTPKEGDVYEDQTVPDIREGAGEHGSLAAHVRATDGVWITSGQYGLLEPSGNSFAATEDDLSRLERRMEVNGYSPMMSRETNRTTATGRLIDLKGATTTAQAFAVGWQEALNEALRVTAEMLRRPAEGVGVSLHTSFGPEDGNIEKLNALADAYKDGDLPVKEWVEGLVRFGVLPDNTDRDELIDRMEAARTDRESQMRDALNMPAPRPSDPEDEDEDEDDDGDAPETASGGEQAQQANAGASS